MFLRKRFANICAPGASRRAGSTGGRRPGRNSRLKCASLTSKRSNCASIGPLNKRCLRLASNLSSRHKTGLPVNTPACHPKKWVRNSCAYISAVDPVPARPVELIATKADLIANLAPHFQQPHRPDLGHLARLARFPQQRQPLVENSQDKIIGISSGQAAHQPHPHQDIQT